MNLLETIKELQEIINELTVKLSTIITDEERERTERRLNVFTDSLYFNKAYHSKLMK